MKLLGLLVIALAIIYSQEQGYKESFVTPKYDPHMQVARSCEKYLEEHNYEVTQAH